jgi:hypothetical protein
LGHAFELEDLVEEVGAAFEGELFRQDEGVVAVEEEGCNLRLLVEIKDGRGRERYFGHFDGGV